MLVIDEDRPLQDAALDEYGLAPISAKLAGSIAGLAASEGVVFGVEGPWGSGKTTFVNFLRGHLQEIPDVHVLTLSPWLMGDSRSLVASLAEAIGPLIEVDEQNARKRFWKNKGSKALKSIDLMRGYAARTGRGMAPLAKLAGLVVPGASAASEFLETGAAALDGLKRGKTDEALKAEIVERILESGLKFVVLIDDLDRLEPGQIVEVMRLIRSVADFPRIAYVLCYDRPVLAHALETGLSLKDGDLFMQKIVQLTFALPRPEPFDLRSSLRKKCIELYRNVIGVPLTGEWLEDLSRAVDREGSALRTPRDVKLVLNNLAFIFPTIADEIYFPDLCRVQLLKTLHPKLYNWIESYLGVRAALVSGDARVSKPDRVRLGEELIQLLPDEDADSTGSIWSLRSYIPGIVASEKAEERIFKATGNREIEEMIERRRVGSPLHHRYYFALSAPKAMIPPQKMEEVRHKAGTDRGALRGVLVAFLDQERPLGQSWYEHFLARLDEGEVKKYSFEELSGLLSSLSLTYETASDKLETKKALILSISDRVQFVVDRLIERMRQLDPAKVADVVREMYLEGDLFWLVGHFHRHHLFKHGLIGDRSVPEGQWVLTADELASGSEILKKRIEHASPTFGGRQHFGSFVWGWRDLSGIAAVKEWVLSETQHDSRLLWFLTSLRSWAVSDRVYYPLRKRSVETFLDYDQVVARLDAIEEAGDEDQKALVGSLKESLSYGLGPD